MSRKNRFIEKLSAEQKSSLERGYKSGKTHIFRRKCQCILKSHEGDTISELCTLYDVTRQSIAQWFNDWEAKDIEGLKLQPGRGRPKKLDINNDKHVKTVKTLVENEPKNLKRVLEQLKSKLDIDKLSKKSLKRFLKNLNTSGSDFESD